MIRTRASRGHLGEAAMRWLRHEDADEGEQSLYAECACVFVFWTRSMNVIIERRAARAFGLQGAEEEGDTVDRNN